jgi:hypothetical protein
MFNVKPASTVPGFRVNPMLDEPGFRVEPERYGFAGADGARSANGGVTPTYVPGPGGGGGGDPLDKCTLMPGTQQFGFCLYLCPDGTVRRDFEVFGCRPWIYRKQGYGL